MDLDNKTKIPFFSALAFIPTLAGGILWLSNIHAKASSAEQKLNQLEQAVIDITVIKKDIEYIKKHIERETK